MWLLQKVEEKKQQNRDGGSLILGSTQDKAGQGSEQLM